ncbi:hypothetical protein Golob_013574, partial [Gossypium lobatum]|nr:hypothetical protein [Gossypium lobatum]
VNSNHTSFAYKDYKGLYNEDLHYSSIHGIKRAQYVHYEELTWVQFVRNQPASIDEKAWRTMLIGWDLSIIVVDGALNVIFSGIDLQEFRTIFKYTTTHEAWTTLETAHERTTSSICKVFRSLRFFMKMTIIKEAKDINTVMIDALNRSLQTFKMNLEEVRRDRLKSEKKTTLQVASSIATAEETSTEKLLKQLALLIKNFNEKFKKLSRKNKGDDGGRGINRNKGKVGMNEENSKDKKKVIQRREC